MYAYLNLLTIQCNFSMQTSLQKEAITVFHT